MVNFCAVYGCSNRSNREKDRSYFRLPAIITRPNDEKQALSKERRATWLARIRRDDLSSNRVISHASYSLSPPCCKQTEGCPPVRNVT